MFESSACDLYKVCRACLTTAADMKPLHVDYTTEICVADVFKSVTSLKFSSEQNHEPINICPDCFLELQQAYLFVLKCRESDEKIRNLRDTIVETGNEINAKHTNSPIFLKVFEEFSNENQNTAIDFQSDNSNDSTKTLFRESLIDKNVDLVDEVPKKIISNTSEPIVVINRMSDKQIQTFRNRSINSKITRTSTKFNVFKTISAITNSETFINNTVKYSIGNTEKSPNIRITEGYPWVCQICRGKYETKRNLIKHMRVIHIGVKPFSCLVCDMTFVKKADIVEHMLIHTREKPHSCRICNQRFKHKTGYKNHMRIHTGEKPYTCNVCAKGFIQRVHLIQHQSKHSEEKPYLCSYCDKTYKRNTSLIRHLVTHTGGTSYSCTVCGDTFKKKGFLMTHLLKHNGGKLYSCTTCRKSFNQKLHLTLHERTHTGERPHLCTVCNKDFSQVANLNRHLRTHTEVKPYSCAICDWSFKEKPNLAAHMQTHQGTRLFRCKICNSPFKYNSTLTRHMTTHMLLPLRAKEI